MALLCYIVLFVVGLMCLQSMLLAMLTWKKRVAWFSISRHACGSLPVVMVLCLVAVCVAGAPLQATFS